MRIAVFGAAGRTGRLTCQALLAAGHEVHAVTRREVDVPGTRRVLDATDAAAVRALAGEVDGVVNAMTSGKGNPSGSGLAGALKGREGLRYVTLAGAAVDAPGDGKGVPDKAISWIARKVSGEVVLDRQRELDLLVAGGHGLRWTMLRPPRLTDKDPRGTWRLTTDKPASTQIARADLAGALAEAVTGERHLGRAPFVSW
jgi:uncharacterized protein YbjT (DUF2867 family)